MTVRLSVIIPAYNERERLPPTLARLTDHLAERHAPWEIVVVDDGSTDGTAALVDELAAADPRLRLLRLHPNRGKGHAVRTGMLAARGAVRVMWDADGSMPPDQLPRLLARLAAGASVAIASRYVDGAAPHGQPLWRRAWSRLCNLAIRHTVLPGVADSQCGFKAFTDDAARELFARVTATGWAFDVELLALARALGHRVDEVGVAWHDDRRSRVRPLRDLLAVLAEAAALRRLLVDRPSPQPTFQRKEDT